ncbi:uncharacterized protein il17rc isoform X1 [Alosa pseudoharengus]|uniref:uncharacterized protein il17rc isoform X1 n=1 Tax=Alosa pseudoharengus TaxID=34774 RepID=UPI003F8A8243
MATRQLNLLGSLLIILQFSINTSAHLKKLEYDSQNPFNLSEGLSVCAMESMFPLLLPWPHSMKVLSIQAEVCLCSTKSSMSMYELCLQVQLELSITNDSFPGSDDDGGGDDEDDGEYPEEEISTAGGKEVEPQTSIATSEEPASLNLCYTIAQGLPRCYKVACAFHSSRKHPRQTEWFGVLLKPKGLTAGSIVHVTADSIRKVTTTVTVPTIATNCTESQLKDCVDPPKLSTEVDLKKGEVHIKVEGKTDKVNICVKSERAGICKPFPRPIPLHSVTPCMCFQAWNKMGKRSENCLFRKKQAADVHKVLRQNVLANVTASVVLSRTYSGVLALSWNVSVPCQEKVVVRLCRLGPGGTCRDMENGTPEGGDDWISNDNGSWRLSGSFLNVSPHHPLCIRMEVMGEEFGPLCPKHARRWHWSIPIVVVVLLFTLIIFGLYSKRTTLEKWIQKWQRTNLRQGGRGHVLLLHPPCEDGSLSEQVCVLGSTLRSLGFAVSLDLWNLMEQGALGPVPWLHAQMELLRSSGGRALVVLSRTALERAEEWTWQGWTGPPRAGRFGDKDSDGDAAPPSPALPPADVFAAALGCLLEDHQRGCASRIFSLVQFDSHSPFPPGGGDPGLPLLFRGLSLYSLPAESQPFLDSLMGLGGVSARPRGKWLSRTLTNSGEAVPLQP